MSEAERKRAFEATEVEKQRNMNYKFKEKQLSRIKQNIMSTSGSCSKSRIESKSAQI